MLRHSTGFKLANDGHDTRSLAHYLGHRNLQSTARYTALAPDRFAKFWQRCATLAPSTGVSPLALAPGGALH
jgi:site-specific recombinase XerD